MKKAKGQMPEERERGPWWHRLPAVLVRASRDTLDDNAFDWAAAVAFYGVLSTVPLLLAGAYAASLAADQEFVIQQGAEMLAKLVPAGEQEVEQLVRESLAQRPTVGVASVLLLLWSGTRVFGSLTKALNIAFDVDELYGFWRRRLTELAMLMSVGVAFLLALVAPWLLGVFSGELPSAEAQGLVSWLIRKAGPATLLVAAFFGLYRFAPRRRPSWRVALPGAVLAALLFAAARELFFFYATGMAEYGATYGSLAVFVMLVVWIWVATALVLFCGEIVSHAHSMFIEGLSGKELERRHRMRNAGKKGYTRKGGA